MEIRFSENKRLRMIGFIVTAMVFILSLAITVLLKWAPRIIVFTPVALGCSAFAALCLKVRIKKWWGFLPVHIVIAFISVFLLHFCILQGRALRMIAFIHGMLLACAIQMILQAIFGSFKVTSIIFLIFNGLFGLLNSALFQFRGSIFMLTDLFAVGTAMNVAGNFSLSYHPSMGISLFVLIGATVAIIRLQADRTLLRPAKVRGLAILCALVFLAFPLSKYESTKFHVWGRSGANRNSVLMNVLLQTKALFNIEPDGYTPEAAGQIIMDRTAETRPADTEAVAAPAEEKKPPHIFVIMLEAFSDLNVLGDFETNMEVLPYLETLKEESIHGYAYASVIGGSTANSEWEFLTSNSMLNLPASTIPYRQYINEPPHSLVEVMKAQGYTCTAMHPFGSVNWSRDTVYPLIGFDELYFKDDLDWGEKVRKYYSDAAVFRQLIAQYESLKPDQRLFSFAVTMQNHSSYNDETFESHVKLEGMKGEYPAVEQYLSLCNITDGAFAQLFDYFRNVDEEVIILMFGDHQPSLSDEFYAEAGLVESCRKYKVPFIMWRNFDDSSENIPDTSLNFLAPMLVEEAGLESTPYLDYIAALNREVSAVSRSAVVRDGIVYDIVNDTEAELPDILKEYAIVQYGNMFDEEMDDSLFTVNP